ncbi:hypothetical protein GCM10010404_50960 [Nonomuraea africana]|uniref:GNAT family N-acetyltransferase n=1 Tax=Nonomuraea africana TaxID=46171 RepID=A0ABR9KH18_9ACTN|nr:hypothetical protein [Nonomuraea africana]MBE1560938.1 hypothetical protein [Nonomuraea africana]
MNVESVEWDDPAAEALREAMSREMDERYADMAGFDFPEGFSVARDSVVYTGVAVTEEGAAVGHVALRRIGGSWRSSACTSPPVTGAAAWPSRCWRRPRTPR